jgi:hypothetical protein
MSKKRRLQHEAKRAQLDHYHALDTEPAEGWDGIDADEEAGDFDARGMAAWPAAQQGQQAHGAKG